MNRREAQITNIGTIAKQLASINFPKAFTGGAVVSLLFTENVIADVRPTEDVDVIIGITKFSDYSAAQEKLEKLNFKNVQDGPICRFKFNELIVDIMPTNGDILGFTNSWYELALKTAMPFLLTEGTEIQLITAPLFLATKLEAFFDRGMNDYMGSHDIEDIIAVIDHRPELFEELENSEKSVKLYLSESFKKLYSDIDFADSISGHLPPDSASQEREEIVIKRIVAIIACADGI